MNLTNYGFSETMVHTTNTTMPARILAVHKERYQIVCDYGQTYAKLKTSVYFGKTFEFFPTTGDFVLISYNPTGDSIILKTLPRKSFFSRRDPDPGRQEQAVAANFDYVFIMQSLNFDFNPKRLERYLTLAWQSNATPVIILTKADLVEDSQQQQHDIKNCAIGVDIHVVSAKTGMGMDQLDAYLKPRKTIVLLGSSGVGKSSFVNALAGENIMAVSDIRQDDSKGRHTTTHRQLLLLSSGVMIIDTPGMRELGMWDVSEGLVDAFSDITQYFGTCKFSNCKHETEPGCAIIAAIASGELSEERFNSYLKLKNEAKYSDNKNAYLRDKQQWHKNISKWNKANKKEDKR